MVSFRICVGVSFRICVGVERGCLKEIYGKGGPKKK